ncbi:HAD-like domain-containing protein [Pseudomassariella vexata]|uniref:HAD-like domain-containing protein n=1 Tax=Pseudomassariella vexata TaxID=1141098 RepID=A0A1Y2DB28_9PEZI|nr:HAD-like domain-containing protein [Pseudomassariella vexata]ORY56407.1 HAD-like domain-containing protein [Pseudomassariella vexata]
MSLQHESHHQVPSFHRGSFVDELESARTDLTHRLLTGESLAESPSTSASAPPLSPSHSAAPSTPPSGAVSPPELTTARDGDLVADSFAFAFDIDGVLIRGGRPIPEAIEAMKVLNGENEYGIKIPYIFLTNGGGKSEAERCGDLSRQLEINISPAQFICGHTPMSEMATKYGTVLVVGGEGEKCRQVAESYGFTDVVTPGDIIKNNSATTPFRKLTAEELANSKERDFSNVTIEAVFVFADSRDWAGDLQIILDIAMSKGGRVGTRSETFEEGPPIYFSHSDVLWSAAHDDPRLGMGALRGIVEYTFKEITKGKTLTTHAFGKPQIGTFEFATRLLKRWRKNAHNLDSPPETVYFVGDTPESDIRGTNDFNAKAENDWYSILVETGVYQQGTIPTYKPRSTVTTVLDAVNFGLRREMERRQQKKLSATNLVAADHGRTNRPKLTNVPRWLLDSTDCAVLSPSEERALELVAH